MTMKMNENNSELEALLATTRFSAQEGYEDWLVQRMDRLVETRSEPTPERITGMRRLIYRAQPDLAPRRPLSAMSLAMLTLGVIAITVLVIWPAMRQGGVPTPAVSDPENLLAETATPTPKVMMLRTPGPEMGLDVDELYELGKAVNLVTDLAFSPDGKTLAIATEGRTEFWNIEARHIQWLGVAYSEVPGINRVAFNSNGFAAVAGESDTIRLFDPTSVEHREPFMLIGSAQAVNDLAFSADGTRLIAAYRPSTVEVSGTTHNNTDDDSVVIWDMTQPLKGMHDSRSEYMVRLLGPITDHDYGGSGFPVSSIVQRVAISEDGSTFAIGTNGGSVRIYYSNGESGGRFWTQQNGITNLSFAVDASSIAATGAEGEITVLTLDREDHSPPPGGIEGIFVLGRRGEGYQFAEYSPDGTAFVTVLGENHIHVSRLAEDNSRYIGVQIKPGSGNRTVTALAFSPSSNVIAIGTSDGSVWLWRWR